MRIYFTSDIHGSDKCWLKFLRCADFYDADVLIVGGDITGKFLVPIITEPDGRVTATFHGRGYVLRSEEEVADLRKRIAFAGSYALEVTREEHDAYQEDPAAVDAVFDRLVLDRVERWMALADERLAGARVECYVSGGNDDDFVVDEILHAAERVQCPEGRVVRVGGDLEMVGLGYANRTPWNCPRDVDEKTFADRIAAVVEHIERPERAIFDFHAPPYGSGLDTAPRLTADLQLVSTSSGEPEFISVGSTAVRDAVELHQPLLGLHGHIHESQGVKRLGRTTVVNPGSEYQEGILNGVLIEVHPRKGVKRAQLVSG